jgi:hypothetical protein
MKLSNHSHRWREITATNDTEKSMHTSISLRSVPILYKIESQQTQLEHKQIPHWKIMHLELKAQPIGDEARKWQ